MSLLSEVMCLRVERKSIYVSEFSKIKFALCGGSFRKSVSSLDIL